jgi:hypothetical protein
VDLTLAKGFGLPNLPVLGENAKFELRIDTFNLFNNLNFNPNEISSNIGSSNFGTITGALSGRVVALTARFSFYFAIMSNTGCQQQIPKTRRKCKRKQIDADKWDAYWMEYCRHSCQVNAVDENMVSQRWFPGPSDSSPRLYISRCIY